MALSISRANRTVSTVAAQVVAGLMPCDLKAQVIATRANNDEDVTDEIPHFRLENASQEWQQRWSSISAGEPGFWTASIIPNNIEPW